MIRRMKVSAVLTQADGVWLAECEEVDRTGEGKTPDEAVASLRQALEEYFEVEAVAPPADAAPEAIEIVILDPPTAAPEVM
jgi:predicted RNase H-like HicB family nuclease